MKGDFDTAAAEALNGAESDVVAEANKRAGTLLELDGGYSGRHRGHPAPGMVRAGQPVVRGMGRLFGWPAAIGFTVVDYLTTTDNRDPFRSRETAEGYSSW